MKNLVIIWMLVFVLIVAIVGSPICSSVFAEDTTKIENAKLTAKLVRGELRKKVAEIKIKQEDLESSVSKDQSKHVQKSESFKIIRQGSKDKMTGWYENEMKKAIASLEKNTKLPDDFKQEILKSPDSEIETNLNKNFSDVFKKSRDKLISEQYGRLNLKIYPTESEIENAVQNNKTEDLKSIILDRIITQNKTEPVFEENVSTIQTDKVTPTIKKAISQYQEQKNIVNNFSGGSGFLPEDAEREILSKINSEIEQKRKDNPGEKIYGVFDSVKKTIPQKAETTTIERFRGVLGSMNYEAEESWIISIIKEDLAGNKDPKISKKICVDKISPETKKIVLRDYCAKAPEKDQKKLAEFVGKIIITDTISKNLLDRINSEAIDASFDICREKVRAEQFEEYFKPLSDKSWKASEKEIELQVNKYPPSIEDPFSFEGISTSNSGGNYDKNLLLDETVASVKKSELEAIGEGINCLRNQMNISSSVKDAKVEALKSRPSIPDVNSFTQEYIKDVTDQWNKNQNTKYPNLFDSVKADCNEKAKYILPLEVKRRDKQAEENANAIAAANAQKEKEEREKQIAANTPKPQPTPNSTPGNNGTGGKSTGNGNESGGGTGGGTGGGEGNGEGSESGGGLNEEPGTQDIDAFVDLDVSDGSFLATIMIPKKTDQPFKFNLNQIGNSNSSDFAASMTNIQILFETWLTSLNIREDNADICVVIRVFDSRVPYGLVYEFRKCLVKASMVLKQQAQQKVKIYILDGLFQKKDKGNRKMPREEIKKNTLQNTV